MLHSKVVAAAKPKLSHAHIAVLFGKCIYTIVLLSLLARAAREAVVPERELSDVQRARARMQLHSLCESGHKLCTSSGLVL